MEMEVEYGGGKGCGDCSETAVIRVAELNLAVNGGRFCSRSCRVEGLQLESGCKERLSLVLVGEYC